MRRDGDRLLLHLKQATKRVLLCAPFIKQNVLKSLLAVVPSGVEVRVVTRWRPEEVRAGVSDLEVFDIVSARTGARLELLDDLHAKIFLRDEQALIGSANLTASALGWSKPANIELLTAARTEDAELASCLSALEAARVATREERDRIRDEASNLETPLMPLAEDLPDDVSPVLWLPRLSAPERLIEAYEPSKRRNVGASVLEAADADLEVLDLPAGLTVTGFKRAVASAFVAMPAMDVLLHEIEKDDLSDANGTRIVSDLAGGGAIPPQRQWEIVRDWLTEFLGDRLEIAPETFITRRRPGVR